MMRINRNMQKNIIADFWKTNISHVDKGKFLRTYMRENNLSLRDAEKDLGKSRGTISGLLKYAKHERLVLQLEEQGKTKTEIANMLKRGVTSISDINKYSTFDIDMEQCIRLLDRYNDIKFKITPKSKDLIEKIFNKASKLMYAIKNK